MCDQISTAYFDNYQEQKGVRRDSDGSNVPIHSRQTSRDPRLNALTADYVLRMKGQRENLLRCS